MATSLFDDIIFGPVKSRRLGVSLGVNLLPTTSKLCNFECIYCECGWRDGQRGQKFNDPADVTRLLEQKLTEMVAEGTPPDVITFAGNGEPTMHPRFPEIIDSTIALRDRIVPTAKISVLSNATMIGREEVREALKKVDNNILKLDSALEGTVRTLNNPGPGYSVEQTVEDMKKFDGNLIIQTMFLRGRYNGMDIDNTTEDEIGPWLQLVKEIGPGKVMIYSIDRDTPAKELIKVPVEDLEKIAERVRALGIECPVAG